MAKLREEIAEIFENFYQKMAAIELENLKQHDSVEEYFNSFELSTSKFRLTEEFKVEWFIKGLKDDIVPVVEIFRPSTLCRAVELAKLQETSLAIISSWYHESEVQGHEIEVMIPHFEKGHHMETSVDVDNMNTTSNTSTVFRNEVEGGRHVEFHHDVDGSTLDELNSTGEISQPVLEFDKDISSGFDVASSMEEVNVFLVSSKQRLWFLDKMPAWGSEESTVLFEYNDISIEEIEKQLILRGFKFNEIQEDSNQGGRVGVLQEYWNEDSFGVVLKQFTGKMEMPSSLMQIHIGIIMGVLSLHIEDVGLKDGIVWKPHKVPFYTNISYLDSRFYPSDGTSKVNVGNDNKSYEDAEKSYGNVELIGEGVNKTGNHRGVFGHMNINIQISNIENTHDEKYVDKRYNGKGMHKVFGKFIIFIWGWHYKDFVKRRETAHPGCWNIAWKIAWMKFDSNSFVLLLKTSNANEFQFVNMSLHFNRLQELGHTIGSLKMNGRPDASLSTLSSLR